MTDYRLYCVGGTGVSKAEWIDAETDEEAIAIAKAKKLEMNCEIWVGARLVAKIPGRRVSQSS